MWAEKEKEKEVQVSDTSVPSTAKQSTIYKPVLVFFPPPSFFALRSTPPSPLFPFLEVKMGSFKDLNSCGRSMQHQLWYIIYSNINLELILHASAATLIVQDYVAVHKPSIGVTVCKKEIISFIFRIPFASSNVL